MEPAHLLVVDDDGRIRDLLARFLRRHGFLVTTAADAARARALLAGLVFDLVVLDVMMPGEDGLSLCREVRRRGGTPVLLLTAKGEAGARIAGLEAGADDYLVKPFEPRELLLRVAAVLRRAGPAPVPPRPRGPARVLSLGPRRYDVERGELLAAPGHGSGDGPGEGAGDGAEAAPLRLTATEAGLMRALAADPGATVTRARLVEEMARGQGRPVPRSEGVAALAQERAVDVQITRLRRKIEPDPRQPRYLQTVRGAGYRLQPD